jgi:hypothetical protein
MSISFKIINEKSSANMLVVKIRSESVKTASRGSRSKKATDHKLNRIEPRVAKSFWKYDLLLGKMKGFIDSTTYSSGTETE